MSKIKNNLSSDLEQLYSRIERKERIGAIIHVAGIIINTAIATALITAKFFN